MKHWLRFSGLSGATLLALALLTSACSNPPVEKCASDADCAVKGADYICKAEKCEKKTTPTEGGGDKDGLKKETPIEKVADKDAGPLPEVNKETPGETNPKKDDKPCPPGCPPEKCGGKKPVVEALTLGASCKEPTKGDECTKDADCKDSKVCLKPNKYSEKSYCYTKCTKDTECAAESGQCLDVAGQKVCTTLDKCDPKKNYRCIQNGIESRGYCYNSCEKDTDCSQGQKCLTNKFCGVQVSELEACNFSRQAFCGQGLTCLVNNSEQTAGICYKQCTMETECDASKNLTCRLLNSSSTNKLCLEKVGDGPLCVGKTCSTSSTATNCLKGLTCINGTCAKTCKTATESTDCDVAGGEKCTFLDLQSPRICQLPPTVKEVGKPCDNTGKRCDDTLGLTCVNLTATKSICMFKCDTTKNDKTDNSNPDCKDKKYLCRQPNGAATGLCFERSPVNGSCVDGKQCGDDTNICVSFSSDGTEAYCLSKCDPTKNTSKDDDTNPDCKNAAGKLGRCVTLNSGGGACIPYRNKTVDPGQDCSTKGGLESPDCKEGSRCVNLGGGPICFVDCDPCTSTLNATGDWTHPSCDGGKIACTPLVYSDGRAAGGVCQSRGNPVLDDGEFCDQPGKDCKEGLICVRFSNTTGAKPLCSSKCEPGKTGECNGSSCGSLTAGGGVCIPQPKRKVDLGQECLGDTGTEGFHDCLEKTKDGKSLICARPAFPGAKRSCQVLCNPVNGVVNNDDCKTQGLTNHLCLPADTKSPTKGACLEKCNFIDRLRCKTSVCQLGECQETGLGKSGECTTTEKEDECKKQGGTCVDKTCVTNVCN